MVGAGRLGRAVSGLQAFTARQPTFAGVLYTSIAILPLFLASAAAVQLQRDLDFDRAHLGIAVSCCFLASMLVSPSLGYYIERVGPSLRSSAVLALASLLVIGLVATSWWHVVVALCLSGVANAVSQVSTNVTLTGVSDERQGIAFGIKQSGVPIASLVGGLAMPVIVALAGWRAGFGAAAVLVTFAVVAAPSLEAARGRGERAPWRPTRLLLSLCLVGLAAGAVGNSLAVFTVDASVAHGMTEGAGGALLAAGSGMAVLTRLGSGWLVDRRRTNGTGELAALTVVSVGAFMLLRMSADSDLLFVVGTLLGFASGWGWQGLIHFATVRSHPSAVASASGLVLTAIYIGMVVGPTTTGLVAQHFSYSDAWLMAALFSAVAAVAAGTARRLARDPAPVH
ncbi:MAG: MFS transporter [Actinomycetota bacterium]|nr:MFS transporter [Actinomycetota bacterium]